MLKVQNISKETIIPSCSDPKTPRCIELSLLDQLAPPIYIHIILFYCTDSPDLYIRLSSSLSDTLNHFYPLAGRLTAPDSVDRLYVECTDEGVDFIQAHVEGDLSRVLVDPPLERFVDLLPIKSSSFHYGDPLLAVQLNTFPGQGFALGFSISHLIADGASMAMFLNCWADTARGETPQHTPRFHASSVFPSRPLAAASERAKPETGNHPEVLVVKRFVLGQEAVERLRAGVRGLNHVPTRVEAAIASVWRCLVRARDGAVNGRRSTEACQSVNLRKRMAPRLSEESFGNLWITASASTAAAAAGGCGAGAGGALGEEEAIRNGVMEVDEEYAKMKAEKQWRASRDMSEDESAAGCCIFSSWCRMPLYKADFGWGEPAWLGCGLRDMKDACILMDCKDGRGVEVWLFLEAHDMAKVEIDPQFLDLVNQ